MRRQRHTEVRDYLETKFAIERSFLTGSYARHTKTKPLKDIDIFFVLKESERHYRAKAPSVVLTDFYDALVEKYGEKAVRKQSRSVNVDFGVVVDAEDNTDYRIISVDVVPAFADGDDYEIPDNDSRQVDQDQSRDPCREGDGGAPGLFAANGRASCAWSSTGTTTRGTARRSRSSRPS